MMKFDEIRGQARNIEGTATMTARSSQKTAHRRPKTTKMNSIFIAVPHDGSPSPEDYENVWEMCIIVYLGVGIRDRLRAWWINPV